MRDKQVSIYVEGALMVALAFGLSWIKVFQAPYGGSVTLGSMVPILLYAARRGPVPGIIAGTAHGLIQLLVEPYVVHPVQVILDYPLAFGSLGLAGFFRDRVVAGSLVGIGGRFLSHFLSGVIFFASYAPKGMNAYLYSAVYNAGYLVPELIISIVVIRFGLYGFVRLRKP